jgi:hypothetical protein
MSIDTGEAENLLNQGKSDLQKEEAAITDNVKAALQKEKTVIAATEGDVTNYLKVNKTVFVLVFFLFIVFIGVVMCCLNYGIGRQQQKIDKYDADIRKKDSLIAVRDAQVKLYDDSIKAKDADILASRDSVAVAYKKIDQLNQVYASQKQKHQKDSVAISHLSLNDKIRFVTGGKR